ncbi:MAG: PH domain-containing protein, partial [Actinobacteria bacterium]|nr:PH domain-containing protein [Actinomycetota bacterium]
MESAELQLRPPRHRVSRRAITWWTVQAVLTVLTLLVPVLVGLLTWSDSRSWLAWATVAVLLLGGVYVGVMPR